MSPKTWDGINHVDAALNKRLETLRQVRARVRVRVRVRNHVDAALNKRLETLRQDPNLPFFNATLLLSLTEP